MSLKFSFYYFVFNGSIFVPSKLNDISTYIISYLVCISTFLSNQQYFWGVASCCANSCIYIYTYLDIYDFLLLGHLTNSSFLNQKSRPFQAPGLSDYEDGETRPLHIAATVRQ